MELPDVKKAAEQAKKERVEPTVSTVLADGSIVEMVYRLEEQKTQFAIFKDAAVEYKSRIDLGQGRVLVPYSPRNNLVAKNVVLFPSEAAQYGSEEELVGEIQSFIHRYVDVSPVFEKVASYYVLFTWVYDDFNELPYLRLLGDPGSGKTRFLLTVGSICYKPIFASGASTVSPLFRIIDSFRGTLLIDEGDFRFSDEKTEIVKILNNGNARGFPVLRSERSGQREFSPVAYEVFGPKLVATRGYFDDKALESRLITEQMGMQRLREDVPINLPGDQKEDALALRNKLLMFRFRNLGKRVADPTLVDRSIEPRLAQVFVPLMSIIEDEAAQSELAMIARQYNSQMLSDRSTQVEAQVLEIIKEIVDTRPHDEITIKEITSRFIEQHGEDYERKITGRWIGNIIRSKLRIHTERKGGNYVVSENIRAKLGLLEQRYGLDDSKQDR